MKIPGILRAAVLAAVCALALTGGAGASQPVTYLEPRSIYALSWMQPGTVLVYREDMTYEVLQGGELSAEEIASRPEIQAFGAGRDKYIADLLVSPGVMVEYDKIHGQLQNFYYPSPTHPGTYQLEKPIGFTLREAAIVAADTASMLMERVSASGRPLHFIY